MIITRYKYERLERIKYNDLIIEACSFKDDTRDSSIEKDKSIYIYVINTSTAEEKIIGCAYIDNKYKNVDVNFPDFNSDDDLWTSDKIDVYNLLIIKAREKLEKIIAKNNKVHF